jgi:hypothetical protein
MDISLERQNSAITLKSVQLVSRLMDISLERQNSAITLKANGYGPGETEQCHNTDVSIAGVWSDGSQVGASENIARICLLLLCYLDVQ